MKFRISIILSVSLLFLSLIISCEKRPKGVLSDDEMVDLLTDLQLVEAYYNTTLSGGKNAERKNLEESVLTKHGVSREELDATITYYGRNIDDYSKLYDKVEKRLRAQNGAAGTVGGNNTDDIWPYGRWTLLMSNQFSEGLTFSIPADNIEPGNMLEWGMHLFPSDGVEIMLGVEYENGNSTIYKKMATSNKSLQVNLQTDTALVPKRIFGVLSAPRSSLPIWADSIRLSKVEFDSMEYSKINMQNTIRRAPQKTSKIETGPVEEK